MLDSIDRWNTEQEPLLSNIFMLKVLGPNKFRPFPVKSLSELLTYLIPFWISFGIGSFARLGTQLGIPPHTTTAVISTSVSPILILGFTI